MSLFRLDSDPSKDQQNINKQRSLSQRYSDLNEDAQDKNQGTNAWQADSEPKKVKQPRINKNAKLKQVLNRRQN